MNETTTTTINCNRNWILKLNFFSVPYQYFCSINFFLQLFFISNPCLPSHSIYFFTNCCWTSKLMTRKKWTTSSHVFCPLFRFTCKIKADECEKKKRKKKESNLIANIFVLNSSFEQIDIYFSLHIFSFTDQISDR